MGGELLSNVVHERPLYAPTHLQRIYRDKKDMQNQSWRPFILSLLRLLTVLTQCDECPARSECITECKKE